jgi:hypothetical protein
LTAKKSRQCVICGNTFFPIKYTKGKLSPRKTCSNPCSKKLYSQQRREWTDDEVQLLRELVETLPTTQMIRVFNAQNGLRGNPKRTAHSIKLKVHHLNLSLRPTFIHTASSLARLLGVSSDAVRYWVSIGLKSTRQTDIPNSPHYITPANLRKFARQRPELFGGINSIDLYIALECEKLVEYITTNYPKRSNFLHPPKRVRCVETGRIYNSYKEAAKAVYVSRSGIHKAVKRKGTANGFHFELVDE